MDIIKRSTVKLTMYVILLIVALLVLLPFLWMIGNSFKSAAELNMTTGLSIRIIIPENPVLDNFRDIFSNDRASLNLFRIIGNTVWTGIASVTLNFLINTLAAYSFARINFRGRNILFFIVMVLLIFPYDLLILPQYILIRDMGLLNTLTAIYLPSIANPFMIFFLRQFFMEVPKELEEAAVIDGCGRVGIFARIMLPLVKAPLFTILIMVFLGQWNNFMWPTTITTDMNNFVLQMAIQSLAVGTYYVDSRLVYAGATITVLPIILLFVLIQKYYVQSLVTSGIKG